MTNPKKMEDRVEEIVEALKEKFIASMVWKSKAVELYDFDEVQTLVIGNVNGFSGFIKEALLAFADERVMEELKQKNDAIEWFAEFIIEKMEGTPDVEGWVRQAIDFGITRRKDWEAEISRLQKEVGEMRGALEKIADQKRHKKCYEAEDTKYVFAHRYHEFRGIAQAALKNPGESK